jgi:dsDNA-specific endonuclease/ATPase MutS2
MKVEIGIGDLVGMLDGTEKGYVTKIDKNKVWFETADGFEITATLNKLVKYPLPKKSRSAKTIKHTAQQTGELETFPVAKKPVIKKVKDQDFVVSPHLIGEEQKHISKKRQENLWEVDLHIEELTDDYKHLTNGEIVLIQLRHARAIVDKARQNKVNKIVFIHGKGRGTLKQELLHLLAGYTFVEVYDASFKRYGGGATEVRIFTSKV